jgi:hypothetical protein
MSGVSHGALAGRGEQLCRCAAVVLALVLGLATVGMGGQRPKLPRATVLQDFELAELQEGAQIILSFNGDIDPEIIPPTNPDSDDVLVRLPGVRWGARRSVIGGVPPYLRTIQIGRDDKAGALLITLTVSHDIPLLINQELFLGEPGALRTTPTRYILTILPDTSKPRKIPAAQAR